MQDYGDLYVGGVYCGPVDRASAESLERSRSRSSGASEASLSATAATVIEMTVQTHGVNTQRQS